MTARPVGPEAFGAADTAPVLLARTVEIPDPGPLCELLPAGSSPWAWLRGGDGVVGWGCAARFGATGPDRFAAARRWWQAVTDRAVVRDPVRLPGSGLLAVGSFAFADGPGASLLAVPGVLVGRRAGRAWVTTARDVAAGDRLPAFPELRPAPPPGAPSGLVFGDGALTAAQWQVAVSTAVARIAAGVLDKVVLARDLTAVARTPVDPRGVLARLAARYAGCWTYAADGLVGATPELLVRLAKGLATSRVLAGTIRRTGDDARDLVLAGRLARSSKDLEEHEYAARSVADGLAPHCSSMNLPETPFVLHLPNVMHLATDVTGVVADGSDSLSLAAALHPSAAVCGTPTAAARELIAELEGMDRGRYAGPVGWLDATGDGEWGIALRCAQIDPADPCRLRLFAGCGIVADSDPADELAEAQAKFVPVRDALGG